MMERYFRSKSVKEVRHGKKEQTIRSSEDWSQVILSGSSEQPAGEPKLGRWYLVAMLGLLSLSVLLMVGRLSQLQIAHAETYRNQATSNRVRVETLVAPRGAIYDRNGALLVRNTANFDVVVSIYLLPRDQGQLNNEIELLSSLLQKDPNQLRQSIEDAKKKSNPQLLLVGNIDRDTALKLEEKQSQLPGVTVEANPSREYLDGGVLAHFLGYVGRINAEEWRDHQDYRQIDMIGKSGIERAYESDLRGIAGKAQAEVDAQSRPLRYLPSIEPVPGNNVVLSIDFELQKYASDALQRGLDRAGSRAGSVVALDPRNGQVLAIANRPSYDNNLFAHGISQADFDSLQNNPDKPLFNRAAGGSYPLGSTIKPLVSVAALQEQVISASTVVEDKGHLDVPNQYNPSIVYVFKGWKPEGLGTVNVVRAIQWSSDIFFYMVGGGYLQQFKGLGVAKLTDWYHRFGLGSRSGLDIGEESAGFVPSPEAKKKYSNDPWSIGDTYNISIGQGDLRATPLQLAVATAAIANGGTIFKPQLLYEVKSPDGQVKQQAQPVAVRNLNIAPANLALVRGGMEQAVESGTACCLLKAEVPVRVAGKTGTAETSSEGFDGKNPRTKPHAWFVSYAPADNPRIVLVTMVENSGEGADYAVPIAREILSWYFRR
jgi:penicillin-binding protein 2